MNTRKLLAAFVLLAGCLHQPAVADVFSFTNNLAIPDGQAAGVSDVQTIATGITQIGSVQVSLSISGNYNGDLYAYVQHNSALSVLLNRPGRTAENPFGYTDSGFAITLMDLSTNGNIHNYAGVWTPAAGLPLTGVWQPAGRTNSPASVLSTDPSPAGLSQFDNLNANGNWTLFIADLSSGGTSVLNSWQLSLIPVPEPSVWNLVVLSLGVASVFGRKGKSKTS